MQTFANRLHRVTLAISVALFGVMFAVQLVIVLMRYVMGVGFLQLQDVVGYSFACLVVLTVPLALRTDRHVRVDILRAGFRKRLNRRIDRAGHLLFTLPVFGLLFWNALPLVANSWAILEGARETGGLPGLFLVKSMVVVMALLVIALALIDLAAGRSDDR